MVCDFADLLILFDARETGVVKVAKGAEVVVVVVEATPSCLKMRLMDLQLVRNSRNQESEEHLPLGPHAYSWHWVEPQVGLDLYLPCTKAQISHLWRPRNPYIVGDARLPHAEVGCH